MTLNSFFIIIIIIFTEIVLVMFLVIELQF